MRRNLLAASALTLAALAVVVWLTWEPGSWRHLCAIGPHTVAAALGLVAATWAVGGLRAWIMVRALGYAARYGTAVRAALVGAMTSNLTPFSGGGGAAEAAVLAREAGIPYSVAMASVTAAGVINQAVLLAVSMALAFSPLPLPGLPAVRTVVRWVLAVYAAGLAGVVAALFRLQWLAGPVERLLTRLERVLPRVGARFRTLRMKTRRFLISMADAFRTVMSGRPGATAAVAVAFLTYYLLLFAVAAVLARGLGGSLSPALLVAAQFPVFLVAGVLPTPGGSGGLEAAMAAVVAPYLRPGAVGIFVAAWRFATYYLTVAAGAVAAAMALGPPGAVPARRRPSTARTRTSGGAVGEGPAGSG